MSTVLKNTNPFKTVLGFATLLDEKGEEMHKSKGNAIEFYEAADKIGVDVMRWMYSRQNPVNNLLFGYHRADEIRRRLYLMLWNVYSFFITYANIDSWSPKPKDKLTKSENILDAWIVSELNSLVDTVVNCSLKEYDSSKATEFIEYFVIKYLSGWYVRRSRDRVGTSVINQNDKENFYSTLYLVLETLSRLLAPFMPFISEEIYMNLTGNESVHLADYPIEESKLINTKLQDQMTTARVIVETAHAARKSLRVKVRQPLSELTYGSEKLPKEIEQLIADEINVKKVTFKRRAKVSLDIQITPQLKVEGEARELIRQIQQARKEAGCNLDEPIVVMLPGWPREFEDYIKSQTLAEDLIKADSLRIKRKA